MAHYVTEVVLRRSIEGLERDQDNVVAESDIEIVDKKFENGCETGDNFLGQIFRVHVSYSVKGAEALRNISLVVKILDHDQHNGEFLAQMNLYSIESHFYKEILPLLKEITHDRGFGPKCYYTQEEPLRLIVMEDLQASGYFMGERQLGLDYDHCALALEKLASFHAASMVLADRQPELMEGFSNGMCNMSVIVDLFYKGFLDTTIGELEKWKEDDKEFGEIMEKLIKLRVRKWRILCGIFEESFIEKLSFHILGELQCRLQPPLWHEKWSVPSAEPRRYLGEQYHVQERWKETGGYFVCELQ